MAAAAAASSFVDLDLDLEFQMGTTTSSSPPFGHHHHHHLAGFCRQKLVWQTKGATISESNACKDYPF